MSYCILGPVVPLRGGIAHYTTLLANELASRAEVNVISFSRLYPEMLFPGKSQVENDCSLKPPEKVDYRLDTMNPFTWRRTAKRIIDLRPDTLIVPFWVTFLVPPILSVVSMVRRRIAVRTLFICHNVIPHDASRMHLLLVKALLKRGEFAIVHSEQEMELIKEAAPHIEVIKHVHPIYDFFACQSPSGEEENPRQPRKALGIEDDKLVLLFFGFVRPYKGLDLLIKAMPRIREKLNAHLLIVGEFWEGREQFDKMVSELMIQDGVTIIDKYVPDSEVSRYFNAADIVILPYREATQSGIIQIAYGFKKPVITTDVGGLPEVVDEGKTGYVVPKESPEAIAETVFQFSQDRGSIDFAANIEAVLDGFSWSRLANVIEAIAARRASI
ncbi:MAG: glycosyltransferase [Candidatus Coatesbacteria bacterium]|nr:glycosyltransferase [Candidatus Coatesbacteria bacterium]